MSYDHKIIDLKYHIKGLLNKKILVIGAGGSARSIINSLIKNNIFIF